METPNTNTINSYGFCYVLLNAGNYLDFSLANITKLMLANEKSRIIIVEGADRFSHNLEQTFDGLSIDNTSDIIQFWKNKYPNKIIYVQLGKICDKRESRNKCLEIAREETSVSHIVNIDGDELFKQKDFMNIDRFIKTSDKPVFRIKHFMFWGDFNTKLTPQICGFKEMILENRHDFRYTWWHTQISANNAHEPLHKNNPESFTKLQWPFYHYGHIQPRYRIFMKKLYSYNQLRWANKNIEKIAGNKNWWETFFKGQPWEENHRIKVEDFDLKKHPSEIKQHPWFNKNKKEIWSQLVPYPSFFYSERLCI
jgi:hypothetical protein